MKYQQKINQIQFYAHAWIQVVQSVLLNVLLVLIYFLGMGLTKFVMLFFGQNLLKPFRVKRNQSTFWVEAKGYNYTDKSTLDKQV